MTHPSQLLVILSYKLDAEHVRALAVQDYFGSRPASNRRHHCPITRDDASYWHPHPSLAWPPDHDTLLISLLSLSRHYLFDDPLEQVPTSKLLLHFLAACPPMSNCFLAHNFTCSIHLPAHLSGPYVSSSSCLH